MYRLFHEFARRYDLHTPPSHYKHDHAMVIAEALKIAPTNCRLLDIGCGTGAFLEKALVAGIDAYGIDASREMIEVAMTRVPPSRTQVMRMQDLSVAVAFDVACALSWTIHYCQTRAELDTLAVSLRRALRNGGLAIVQAANDSVMNGSVNIEREPGPNGEPDDTVFIHRFTPTGGADHTATADYAYASIVNRELLCERHELRFANPSMVVESFHRAGFQKIDVINAESISPFVAALAE